MSLSGSRDGEIKDGHYYLAQHSRLVEVSEAVWTYSYVHSVSVLVLTPMAVVGGLLSFWGTKGLLRGRSAAAND